MLLSSDARATASGITVSAETDLTDDLVRIRHFLHRLKTAGIEEDAAALQELNQVCELGDQHIWPWTRFPVCPGVLELMKELDVTIGIIPLAAGVARDSAGTETRADG